MKKQKFLAFVPSVSTLPLEGKEIVKSENKIEIIDPKPIELLKDVNNLFGRGSELCIVHEGKIIARGFITEIKEESIDDPIGVYIEGCFYSFEQMNVEDSKGTIY